jgi:16S rRNA (cytosine1407-C5)-methyltransferase
MTHSASSSAALQAFDRYASFTDLRALKEVSMKPLRKSMRVNTLKCAVTEFQSWAKAKKWTIEPVPWCPEGFFVDRVNREEAMGKDLLHVLGYTYLQEAASMLPVSLLDPKPGETVLDMSAAPGSKTTQIAARMQERGTLIANDVQEKRIWSLISNLQRCGVINVIVVRKVGQWFAGNMTEKFDRVLCDAPCTAQGTVRKDSDALTYCSQDNIGKMARLQRELLESAIHATKVGGRIVYSTCTLTPEENEGVVMSILRKFGDQLKVVDPRENEQWKIDNGQWDAAIADSAKVQKELSKDYPLSIVNYPFLRLWPQTCDTEGFFSAVLEKRAPTKDRRWQKEEPEPLDFLVPSRVKEVTERLADWYGTSFLREQETLLATSELTFVLPKEFHVLRLPVAPYMSGLPFGKLTNHGLTRLSHEMATLRGHEATKQVLRLDAAQFKDVFQGKDLAQGPVGIDDGDVLLAIEDPAFDRPIVIGRGVLKGGKILNRLPREIVRMFG